MYHHHDLENEIQNPLPSASPFKKGDNLLAHFFKKGTKGEGLDAKSVTVTNLSTFHPFNHSTNYPSHLTPHPSRKCAFTLAEVLITLGIIGIVAALTLSILIPNYQKKQTIAQLKQFHSIFYNAIQASEQVNGDRSTWDYSLTHLDFYNAYLKDHLKVRNPARRTGKIYDSQYKTLNNRGANLSNIHTLVYIPSVANLPNGMDLFFNSQIYGRKNMQFSVDLNGINNGPNVIGKDFFYFIFSADRNFFEGTSKNRESLKSNCNKNSTAKDAGKWCYHLFMLDGWEIAKDVNW